MTKPHRDKRSSRRVKASSPAKVQVINSKEHDGQAQLRDVSLRGVYMYLQNRVAVGTTLEVVLPLPTDLANENHKWIRCKCRVVRVEETGNREHGVAAMIEEFESLDRSDIARA